MKTNFQNNVNKKPDIFKFKPLRDEVEGSHKTVIASYDIQNINVEHKQQYEVYGIVYNLNLSTELNFTKTFTTKKSAEEYFNNMKKEYPLSEIMFKGLRVEEFKLYC